MVVTGHFNILVDHAGDATSLATLGFFASMSLSPIAMMPATTWTA